eukprot:1729351-Amphidinium_carterae.1
MVCPQGLPRFPTNGIEIDEKNTRYLGGSADWGGIGLDPPFPEKFWGAGGSEPKDQQEGQCRAKLPTGNDKAQHQWVGAIAVSVVGGEEHQHDHKHGDHSHDDLSIAYPSSQIPDF